MFLEYVEYCDFYTIQKSIAKFYDDPMIYTIRTVVQI